MESGVHPTRRVTGVTASDTASPSVEFPLRVHDAERLEHLVAEYAVAARGDVPEAAMRAIATRRAWIQAEQRVDAAILRRQEQAPLSDRSPELRGLGARSSEDSLAASALRLRVALSDVHRAVAIHGEGRALLESEAWAHLRGAYDWITELLGPDVDEAAPPTPRPTDRPKR